MGAAGIIRALIGHPTEVPHALRARFPELESVRWRRGGIPVYVAGWFLRQRCAAAITLWNVVFLAPDAPLDAELLLHELRHVHQFEASVAFPIEYLWESVRRGYYANRFEADARAYAARRLRGAC